MTFPDIIRKVCEDCDGEGHVNVCGHCDEYLENCKCECTSCGEEHEGCECETGGEA